MSDRQRIFSPNQRFFLLLERYDMRMSHRIINMSLWETALEQAILQPSDVLWSAEHVDWHADSSCLTVKLWRYPGDAPAICLAIYPEQRVLVPYMATRSTPLPYEALDAYLASYYQQYQAGMPDEQNQ